MVGRILLAVCLKWLGIESGYKRVMSRIKSKYGIALWIDGSIKLTRGGVRCHDVMVEYSAMKINIDVQCIIVTIDIKRWFSNRKKVSHLILNDVRINIKEHLGLKKQTSFNPEIKVNGYISIAHKFLNSITILQQNMQRLCERVTITNVIVEQIQRPHVKLRGAELKLGRTKHDENSLLLTGLSIKGRAYLKLDNVNIRYQLMIRNTEVDFMFYSEFQRLSAFATFLSNKEINLKYLHWSISGNTNTSEIQIRDSVILTGGVDVRFKLGFVRKEALFALSVEQKPCSLAKIIALFPTFNYQPFNTMEAIGKAGLVFSFNCSLKDLTTYSFNSRLNDEGFKFGQNECADLSYLKEPFVHQIIGAESDDKNINVSPESSQFAEWNSLSDNLVYSIIWCEDPTFLLHEGVEWPFLGLALAVNLSKGSFFRGNSTITMQLARNLFLGHHKNLQRKVEEIALALLMEKKMSKERIFEIYVNIIEWGPGIYGIVDATRFYFGKEPQDLSFTECLVLTYIIPRPKHFLSALHSESTTLVNNLREHINSKSIAMFHAGIISEYVLKNIVYKVKFANRIRVNQLNLEK